MKNEKEPDVVDLVEQCIGSHVVSAVSPAAVFALVRRVRELEEAISAVCSLDDEIAGYWDLNRVLKKRVTL